MVEFFSRLFYRKREIGSDEYARLVRLRQTNMSEVWLAERKRDRAITVIKIARVDEPRYVRANQRAIRNEAAYLASFQRDPSVVQMYHAAETDLEGSPRFLAVEYLQGGTLDELLQQPTGLGQLNHLLVRLTLLLRFKRKLPKVVPNRLKWLGVRDQQLVHAPLSVEQALQLFHDIAKALSVVHRAGVVHRDIKPDNIMFRKRPRSGYFYAPENLVLIDFGVAHRRDRLSGIAIARGWSEQRLVRAREEGEKLIVKPGFDIYCLGKILRYLLTGERPTEQNEARFRENLDAEQLRFYSRLSHSRRQEVATTLSTLIRRCMADDPEQRPSAETLVAEAAAVQESYLRALPVPGRRVGVLATTGATCLVAALLAFNLMGARAGVPDVQLPSFFQTILAGTTVEVQPPVAVVALADKPIATTALLPTATVTATPTDVLPPPPSPTEQAPLLPVATATDVPPTVTRNILTPARITPTRDPTPTRRPPTATPTTAPVPIAPAPQEESAPALCVQQGTVIMSPANGARVSGIIDLQGTANHAAFAYYKIEFAQGSRTAGDFLNWAYHSESRSAVTSGLLGQFDTRPLQDGQWTLRLVVPDDQGKYPNPDPCEVMIEIDNQ